MKEEFLRYFQSIGIKGPILARIEELLQYTETLVPGFDLTDVVVNETVDRDGNRIYEDLRFFSKDVRVAILNFISETKITYGVSGSLKGVTFEAKDFDFRHATERSRLSVLGVYPSNESFGIFRGSGGNCDHIMNICRNYIFPRIRIEGV